MTVHEYILDNWQSTIRDPKVSKPLFNIPFPYTTPCADEVFVSFFYWDTYFTNLGLLRDGLEKQALNNLENIAFYIRKLGYMPNADGLPFRSQPPLFVRGLYDYWKWTGDIEAIRRMSDALDMEMNFFETSRTFDNGLSHYDSHEPIQGLRREYETFSIRVGYTEEEKKLEPDYFARSLLAIAESGWDFNPRFSKKGNRFASLDFAHLDLNCILYDAEAKAALLFKELGDVEKSISYSKKAQIRKELIRNLMKDPKNGVYRDYDIVDGEFSKILSSASFYPYALGVDEEGEGAKYVLSRLLLPFGISACEYRGKDAEYLQWDYPTMWPSNAYFAYEAMKNLGKKEEAKMIKDRYMRTVEHVYEKTGKLWEKYDARSEDVSVTREYATPTMMGWTAGIYEYFLSQED